MKNGMQFAKVLKDTQHASGNGRLGMTPKQRHEFATEVVSAAKKRTYEMMVGPVPKAVVPSYSLNLTERYRP